MKNYLHTGLIFSALEIPENYAFLRNQNTTHFTMYMECGFALVDIEV